MWRKLLSILLACVPTIALADTSKTHVGFVPIPGMTAHNNLSPAERLDRACHAVKTLRGQLNGQNLNWQTRLNLSAIQSEVCGNKSQP
jgi:hypothetical protein